MMRTRVVLVERLEHQPQLIALRHRDNIIGCPVEDDVGAFVGLVDLNLESVQLSEPGVRKSVSRGHVVFLS